MASQDYIPKREAELVTWSTNFKTLIVAAPTDYGLTAAQASAYETKHDAFVSAHQTANDPSTRTPSTIVAKNTAKAALEAEARKLARIIQAHPSVSDAQKSELGLTVRDVEPTPVPPPSTRPVVTALGTSNWNVRVRIADETTPTKRAKPTGVAGANIFSFIGENPPAELNKWEFEGQSTRSEFAVVFPTNLEPGAKVWVAACWYNSRGQIGPVSQSVAVHIGPGIAQAA